MHKIPLIRTAAAIVVLLSAVMSLANFGISHYSLHLATGEQRAVSPARAASALAVKSRPNSNKKPPSSPYAYAFVVAGADPDQPAKYRFFLYGVYIAIYNLRNLGSKADFYVFVEMYHTSSARELPLSEARALHALGGKIKYVPPSSNPSFYQVTLNKFRILGLTQYRRVIFLDSDVMPMANLDYLFALSDGPTPLLQENLILPSKNVPSNAGVFMLAPKPGDLEEINEIIQQKEKRADPFDPILGWGHKIVPPDHWESGLHNGTLWDYHYASGDQGLLYHWVKYVKRKFSIVMYNEKVTQIQNWVRKQLGDQAELKQVIEHEQLLLFLNYSAFPKPLHCWQFCKSKIRSDVVHFTADRKPWMNALPDNISEATKDKSPAHFWFATFRELSDKLGLSIDLKDTVVKRGMKKPRIPQKGKKIGALTNLLDMDYS